MSDEIQALYIRTFSKRSQPSLHIVYPVEIHARSSRSWTVWRRYSSFVELDSDLSRETGSTPPVRLPSKNVLSKFAFWSSSESSSSSPSTSSDPKLQERREGLEKYLRTILTHRDSRWRDSRAFKEFIAVPVGVSSNDHLRNKNNNTRTQNGGKLQTDFTTSSWIDEQSALHTLCREIHADINRRDELSASSVSEARQTNVQAKKKLATLVTRTSVLAKGLEELGTQGMPQGELRRRTDLVSKLQDEMASLGKLTSLSYSRPGGANSSLNGSSKTNGHISATNSQREQLMGVSSEVPGKPKPTPTTRRLGAKAQETSETMVLDNGGIMTLQERLFDEQDTRMEALSAVIKRQRELGLAINQELSEQNDLLDGLNKDLDATDVRMKKADKEMKRLGK